MSPGDPVNQPPQPQQPPSQPPMPQQAPGVGVPPPMPGQSPMGGQPPMQGQPPMGGQFGAPGQVPMPGQGYRPPGPQYGAPGQVPMQQGWPGQPMQGGYPAYPGGGMGQPRQGSPASAFFLGLLASFVVSVIYTAINVATLRELSHAMVNTLLIGHALLNGGVVGWIVGLVGRRSTGAHSGGAVVAVLGAFFGFTNSIPFVMGEGGGFRLFIGMMKHEPLFPAEMWWGSSTVGHLLSLLSLLAAAGAAWGVAHAVSRRRP